MTIKTGEKLPQASFMTVGENGPEPKTTDDLFSGKRVALFAVPGAFTPTCSAQHLPSFIEKAEALKAAGVDDIACVSVNDIFVMGAWGEQQEVGSKVSMLADGNGDFTKDIGLVLDGTGFGMGQRSQRYAMVVNDGVVEHLFVEAPGEYKVSSAEHMLEALGG
jgi:peroxiredoxin